MHKSALQYRTPFPGNRLKKNFLGLTPRHPRTM